MPKFYTESNYLKKEEVEEMGNGQDLLLTISHFAHETLENQGKKQKKFVLYFREIETKGFPLNATNGNILVDLYGSEMDNWIAKKMYLYLKPDVEMGGKLMSAIRIRMRVPNPTS